MVHNVPHVLHVPNAIAHVPNVVAHVPNDVAHVPNVVAHIVYCCDIYMNKQNSLGTLTGRRGLVDYAPRDLVTHTLHGHAPQCLSYDYWQVPATQWCSWSIKPLTGVSNLEHFIFSLFLSPSLNISPLLLLSLTLPFSLLQFLRKKDIY